MVHIMSNIGTPRFFVIPTDMKYNFQNKMTTMLEKQCVDKQSINNTTVKRQYLFKASHIIIVPNLHLGFDAEPKI